MPQQEERESFQSVPTFRIDYANELNPQQYAAVTAPPGPALILAGAGSGKTRTLTYRVAYLLEQGVPPDRILLLTFTNKASREMMHRVSALLGRDLPALWGGTFHSIGARILRNYGQSVGCRQNFVILDRADAEDLLVGCINEAGIDRKAKDFPKVETILEWFSQAANRRLETHEFLGTGLLPGNVQTSQLQQIHDLYSLKKRESQLLDFDDLLILWLRLIEQDSEVRELLQRRFQFILVDEYQDTNRIQAEIIDLLGSRSRNVMVVGDDSQSIYSWRGADLRNILDFTRRYPSTSVFKIEQNYRSTPEILNLANAAISVNEEQFPKTLRASLESGNRPVLAACLDGRQQADFVSRQILEHLADGVRPEEIAVLYRSHFHVMELQMELVRRQIPFSITSGIRFFEQAHIKDVAAFLRLAANPFDEVGFKRVACMLPGVGEKSALKIWGEFRSHLGTAASATTFQLAELFQKCSSVVPAKARAAWASWSVTISRFYENGQLRPPSLLIREVLDGGYSDQLETIYDSVERRKEDIEQLRRFAEEFVDLPDFLTQVSLLSAAESEDSKQGSESAGRIRLSTIHQAKGLEFEVVFLVMLAEGLFPTRRALDTRDGIEEERRLFYVGITRAKYLLYLTYPLSRSFGSGGAPQHLAASRFLNEIGSGLVEEWNVAGHSRSSYSW